jgi:hypothetical protein
MRSELTVFPRPDIALPLRSSRCSRIPRFSIWCGTRKTEGGTAGSTAVVVGSPPHPRTRCIDGVRFEEVSLGYPRQWTARGRSALASRILPPPVAASEVVKSVNVAGERPRSAHAVIEGRRPADFGPYSTARVDPWRRCSAERRVRRRAVGFSLLPSFVGTQSMRRDERPAAPRRPPRVAFQDRIGDRSLPRSVRMVASALHRARSGVPDRAPHRGRTWIVIGGVRRTSCSRRRGIASSREDDLSEGEPGARDGPASEHLEGTLQRHLRRQVARVLPTGRGTASPGDDHMARQYIDRWTAERRST